MKVCFITNDIFTLGGVQRVLSVLADKLTENHNVTVLCSSNTEVNRDMYNISNNLKVDIKPEIFKSNIFSKSIRKVIKEVNKKTGMLNNKKCAKCLLDIYYPLSVRKRIIKYINENKYDFVVGVEGIYSILLGSIYKEIDAKVIGWQHNSYDAYLNNKERYFWNLDILFEEYITKLDKYVVLNKYDKNKFKEEKAIECQVIANPRSFKSKNKSLLKEKQFLAAGRFTYQKGFDLLIESFNKFSKLNSEWNLVIVGEGEEKENIKELIKKNNLQNRVTIKSFSDNIKKYFIESSVLLLPSRWEGMPMIVLESLEMGVPIISFDITAIQEMIYNKQEGLIVEKYNVDKFSEAMLKLSQSYDLRKEMGTKCLKKSNEYDIDFIVEKWETMFDNISSGS